MSAESESRRSDGSICSSATRAPSRTPEITNLSDSLRRPEILKFPTTPDAITAEWLSACLQRGGFATAEVATFTVNQLGAGAGQTGLTARIGLQYTGSDTASSLSATPASFIIKMATENSARRAFTREMGMYQREVDFYRNFATDLTIRVPRCFFAEIDKDEESFAIVLEDFPNHRAGDETLGCSIEDARLAVREMAKLHASNWGRPPAHSPQSPPLPSAEQFRQAWSQMLESFGDSVPEDIRAIRDKFIARIPDLYAWISTDGPVTLVHGDFKLDNLLFGDADKANPIVVLDWQAPRIAKGIQDFAYFVSQNIDPEVRRPHEADLLALYLDSLAKYGVIYPKEQCVADYRKATILLLYYVILITGKMVNSHERAIRRKKSLLRRTTSALLDRNAFSFLEEP